jgi:hypothetical protein
LEGAQHPDRNAQFQHIADRTKAWHADGVPVISVDAKKRELLGDFKNASREWHATGHPPEVQCHDFAHLGMGKAVPYGVYEVAHQASWVAVGQDHDTAQLAVHTIERWWQEQGRVRYPDDQDLYIVADGGGSNGSGWACGNSNSNALRQRRACGYTSATSNPSSSGVVVPKVRRGSSEAAPSSDKAPEWLTNHEQVC